MTIQVLPATPADAHTLADIEHQAFASDLANKVMFGPPNPSAITFRAKEIEKQMAENPTAQFVKAVIDDKGTIAGWAQWHFYVDDESLRIREEKRREKKEKGTQWPETANANACNEFFGAIDRVRDRMDGIKHAHISVLVTLPSFQGRGAGSALLKYGLDFADKNNVPSWIEASPSGYNLYKKFGYEDVETLVFDLSKYGGEGETKTVGMLRPVPKKSE